MRNVIIVLAIAVFGYGIYYFFFRNESGKQNPEEDMALRVGDHSSEFDKSYSDLLDSYIDLKDALVASDTAKANQAAQSLIRNADSLAVGEIKGDTSGVIRATARDYALTISGSAKGFIGEETIQGKRKEFEMITDALWTLTRTVQYGGKKIYYQHCPMAFDGRGAYWISDDRKIRNPYFGDQMLECGSVEDSLDYRR